MSPGSPTIPAAEAYLAHARETGAGLPTPDILRAFVWYNLATLGSQIDAVRHGDRLRDSYSAEETAHAQSLIEDDKALLYLSR